MLLLENFSIFWTISSECDKCIGSQNNHAQSILANTLAYQNTRKLKNYISSNIELKYREVLFRIQWRHFGVSHLYGINNALLIREIQCPEFILNIDYDHFL